MSMPELQAASNATPGTEESVRAFLRTMLAQLYPEGRIQERRRDRRFPFPHLVRLTPVAADGHTVVGEPLVVVGKHLSERGFGFFHPEPIAPRFVIAQLETPQGKSMYLLLDLNWCRFTKEGWYESGGHFQRVVSPASEVRSQKAEEGRSQKAEVRSKQEDASTLCLVPSTV